MAEMLLAGHLRKGHLRKGHLRKEHLRKGHLLPASIKQERATLCGYPLLYLRYVKLSDCQQRHW